MGPGTSIFHLSPHQRHDHGAGWPIVVAIVFAAFAAISFAVDQSVTLSNLPAAASAVRR